MELEIRPLNTENIRSFASWRFQPPYNYYNCPDDEQTVQEIIAYYTDPQTIGYGLFDAGGGFVGLCSFGPDGQVSGGDYSSEALDIGVTIRPDLTGKGNGYHLLLCLDRSGESRWVPRLV